VSSAASICEEVDPGKLLAFSQTIPTKLKRELLGTMRERPTLVCSPTGTRIGRMLILDHDQDAGPYLGVAVELCHQIGATPIVLTVAGSMDAATSRQQWAQSTVQAKGLNAEFDLLVGFQIHHTVLAIARWRRCQIVVMDCQRSPSWLRWLRAPEGSWIEKPIQSIGFLTLPQRAAAVPTEANGEYRESGRGISLKRPRSMQ
jgi:hypothetical protein